jgi:hypothetical protein
MTERTITGPRGHHVTLRMTTEMPGLGSSSSGTPPQSAVRLLILPEGPVFTAPYDWEDPTMMSDAELWAMVEQARKRG